MKFVIFFSVILAYLAIVFTLAVVMDTIAIKKGYGKESHAFSMCFWLTIVGYIYVCALPDKIVIEQNEEIIKLLKEQNEKAGIIK